KYLKQNTPSPLGSTIKWNFTKFLVGRDGVPVKRYAPKTRPQDMTADIERLL
ncbi:MAG: glutathione peroxidase, partial [Leuconostoc citreum]|nr:glutathione peroxidase [Leuconostoc citreum]